MNTFYPISGLITGSVYLTLTGGLSNFLTYGHSYLTYGQRPNLNETNVSSYLYFDFSNQGGTVFTLQQSGSNYKLLYNGLQMGKKFINSSLNQYYVYTFETGSIPVEIQLTPVTPLSTEHLASSNTIYNLKILDTPNPPTTIVTLPLNSGFNSSLLSAPTAIVTDPRPAAALSPYFDMPTYTGQVLQVALVPSSAFLGGDCSSILTNTSVLINDASYRYNFDDYFPSGSGYLTVPLFTTSSDCLNSIPFAICDSTQKCGDKTTTGETCVTSCGFGKSCLPSGNSGYSCNPTPISSVISKYRIVLIISLIVIIFVTILIILVSKEKKFSK